jgi:hypothetical protein
VVPAQRITARTIRTDVVKWRLGQAFAPFCVGASVLARRTMSPLLIAGTACLFAVALSAFARARRSFGWSTLQPISGRLRIGDEGGEIACGDVLAWTIDGAVARLYTGDAGWRFRVPAGDSTALCLLLTSMFGPPLALRRRGSLRARRVAGAVTVAGLALAIAGIALDVPMLPAAGVLAFVFGVGAMGALSQKVTSLPRPP